MYPESNSPVSPVSLYEKSVSVKQIYGDMDTIKTHREIICEFTSMSYGVGKIVEITGIEKQKVERIINYEKLLKKEIRLGEAQIPFSLWFLNI